MTRRGVACAGLLLLALAGCLTFLAAMATAVITGPSTSLVIAAGVGLGVWVSALLVPTLITYRKDTRP